MAKLINWILFILLAIISVAGFLAAADALYEQSTASTATVQEYVAIGLSDLLATGVPFGSLNPNTNDNNATDNYGGSNTNTQYNISISADTNIAVDLCVKDNANLTTGANTIPNIGYTWIDNSTANSTSMSPTNSNSISTIYTKTNVTNIAKSNYDHFRFFLDVPGAQAAGTYNNTVTFKGIKTGAAC